MIARSPHLDAAGVTTNLRIPEHTLELAFESLLGISLQRNPT